MTRNITMEPHEAPEVNQASGNSIFWALVALALNAMTEPSRTQGFFISMTPHPGFDLLRSSPVVCALETAFDIYFFFFDPKPQRIPPGNNAPPNIPWESRGVWPGSVVSNAHQPEQNPDNAASPRATLKVLGFFLGVLPQAIKLFSMRGIAGTQICAAMFLAASVTRAISFKSPSHFAASFQILENIEIHNPTWLSLSMIVYGVVYVWIYFSIATAAVNDRSANILFQLTTFAILSYIMFALFTVLFNLVWRRSVPRSKWMPLLVCTLLQSLDTSKPRYTETGALAGSSQAWFKSYSLAYSLVLLGLICCILISVLCVTTGRVLTRLAARRAAHYDEYSDTSLPIASPNADEPRFMGLFQVIDTLKRGMVWLKDVFVGLCKALDNHGE